MKIKLHENGWTVVVEDFQIQNATKQETNTIAKLLSDYTVVVFRKQNLTVHDEIKFCEMIGNLEDFNKVKDLISMIDDFVIPDSEMKVIRVTGELNEHGKPGLFGHVSDLDWHANQTANEWRHPVVWLYGVKGTAGSRTSWINNIASYNDLSDEYKRKIENIKLINGYKQGAYSETHFGRPTDINYNYKPNLVHTNITGKTGLFFPFLQIHQIDGMSESESKDFIINLRDHVLQEKYMYHHDWEDGDVVLAEQWLGIHKRWRFENINQRVLHRITLDFKNTNFDDIDFNLIQDLKETND